MSLRTRAALLIACIAAAGMAGAEPRRRALLIGINDYTASAIRTTARAVAPGRDWPNLNGAVNDVGLLQEMLVLLYGFDRRDIVTLTDQAATRAAILQSVEQHLVAPAAKDDVLFFYFAGHGSRVRNSRSDEPDQFDESIVPADSRLGAPDVRDKELRGLFNRMLDRGARLTVMLDNCHSGSGARGLPTGARARGVKADLRDVRDPGDYGPRPESRGALVLSATQDFDQAWEKRDSEGKVHGAFTWSWILALRDAPPGEAAADTYLRAAARMRAETPYQDPVMAGTPPAQYAPFLGIRGDRRGDRTVVAVENVSGDGTSILLHGGWANGLSIGTELRVVGDRATTSRVVVTALHGLARSEARMQAGRTVPQSIRSGALLEVVAWAAPPGRPLRVWAPRVSGNVQTIASLGRRLSAAAAKRGLRWVADPTESPSTYLLRWSNGAWELLGREGAKRLGPDAADAIAAVAKLRSGSSFFVQLPLPMTMVDEMSIEGTDGIMTVARAEDADYILTGRYSARRLKYAWVRPAVRSSERRKFGLPIRTAWMDSPRSLRDSLLRLRRIHAWHLLESPPESRSPYRLAVRRAKTRALVTDNTLIGDEHYELVLRMPAPRTQRVQPRYFYVFVIDSHGAAILLFPRHGSVENRFPDAAPTEFALGQAGAFAAAPPYGIDTYFLLTTDEPLQDPWILRWDGVRAPSVPTPLEQLLMLTDAGTRSGAMATPSAWSIERVVFECVSPRRH